MVFESLEDLSARIDDPDLDVTPDDVLVLQNAGPKSGTGMPEAGYLPIPGKLARAGVKDMIRISDARMSGTAFGTIVLHVTPEAAQGGPLGLVRSGDRIRLSVARAPSRSAGPRGRAGPASVGRAAAAPRARPRLRQALPRPRPARGSGLRLRFPEGVALTRRRRDHSSINSSRLTARAGLDILGQQNAGTPRAFSISSFWVIALAPFHLRPEVPERIPPGIAPLDPCMTVADRPCVAAVWVGFKLERLEPL